MKLFNINALSTYKFDILNDYTDSYKGDKNLEFIYNIINGTLISKMGEELVKKFKIQDKILFKK